jgi:hypothetical protein
MPQRAIIPDHHLVVEHQSLPMIYAEAAANFCVPGYLYAKDPFNQNFVKDAIGKTDVPIYFTGSAEIGDPE